MSEQEMIERYIYDVVKRVPQDCREEIRMELQSLIDDMCEQENSSVEEVLQKLGEPAKFARRYRDEGSYLIGPDYYDDYVWIVKIALFGIGISALVSAVVNGITNSGDVINFLVEFFGEFFETLINGSFSVIGTLTIIFAIMEKKKAKLDIKPGKKWSVKDLSKNVATVNSWTPFLLPAVPDKRAVISRGDSVFSIIFTIVFIVLLIFAPQVFGAFHYEGGKLISSTCIFNLDEWDRIVPLFVFSLFVGMVNYIVRLVIGYHCKTVMYSTIITNTVQIAIAFILLNYFPFFNVDFANQVKSMMEITTFSNGDILFYWGSKRFDNFMLLFIVLISLLDIGVSLYKTLRYNNKVDKIVEK
ncbi:MAG: hypothetical protein IJD40_05430 [Lachnospiraceae bacterium]|nr:hypothetical protein [Lachnospiraceae bacterium]